MINRKPPAHSVACPYADLCPASSHPLKHQYIMLKIFRCIASIDDERFLWIVYDFVKNFVFKPKSKA